jgi:hypothetical protein
VIRAKTDTVCGLDSWDVYFLEAGSEITFACSKNTILSLSACEEFPEGCEDCTEVLSCSAAHNGEVQQSLVQHRFVDFLGVAETQLSELIVAPHEQLSVCGGSEHVFLAGRDFGYAERGRGELETGDVVLGVQVERVQQVHFPRHCKEVTKEVCNCHLLYLE